MYSRQQSRVACRTASEFLGATGSRPSLPSALLACSWDPQAEPGASTLELAEKNRSRELLQSAVVLRRPGVTRERTLSSSPAHTAFQPSSFQQAPAVQEHGELLLPDALAWHVALQTMDPAPHALGKWPGQAQR